MLSLYLGLFSLSSEPSYLFIMKSTLAFLYTWYVICWEIRYSSLVIVEETESWRQAIIGMKVTEIWESLGFSSWSSWERRAGRTWKPDGVGLAIQWQDSVLCPGAKVDAAWRVSWLGPRGPITWV